MAENGKRTWTHPIRRCLFLCLGLIIMAFGVAFSIKAGLGTSPISSLPYVTAEISGLTVGTTTIIMNFLFVLIQIAILRRQYDWFQLLQFPAANLLAGRFNPAGFIRAWNDIPGESSDTRGWAIIDCLFNIPLLYWAGEETGDPRFRKIAVTHADTVLKHFVRPDGSVRHIVELDPETGAFVRDYGGRGYAQGSSWTRGQTWGLYGFVISFRHTREVRFLAAAQKIAEYFIAHIPADGKIPVDFCQPGEPRWYDDIAAAVAACGLLELAALVPERAREYLGPALLLLRNLDATADWSPETDGFRQNCSPSYHSDVHNVNYTYGDFYFYEALLKLCGRGFSLW